MKRLGIRAQRAARRLGAPAAAEVGASLHWSGRVPPGGVLEVRGLNGPVRVEASADGRVDVLAERRGPSALLAALEVKVVEHARGVTVCAVWQGLDASVSRRVERRVSRGLADVRVDIVARVHPGVRVVASTINGDIEVVGLGSAVEASTANGRVRFLPGPPPAGTIAIEQSRRCAPRSRARSSGPQDPPAEAAASPFARPRAAATQRQPSRVRHSRGSSLEPARRLPYRVA
jgi:hypothetical protein